MYRLLIPFISDLCKLLLKWSVTTRNPSFASFNMKRSFLLSPYAVTKCLCFKNFVTKNFVSALISFPEKVFMPSFLPIISLQISFKPEDMITGFFALLKTISLISSVSIFNFAPFILKFLGIILS